MTERLPQPLVPQGVFRAIASTTDVTALCREVIEAYRLTVSLQRDIAEIKNHHETARLLNADIHEEVMLALTRSYDERGKQVDMIEKVVLLWTASGHFEIAHAATMKMLELLAQSPLEQAFRNRRL